MKELTDTTTPVSEATLIISEAEHKYVLLWLPESNSYSIVQDVELKDNAIHLGSFSGQSLLNLWIWKMKSGVITNTALQHAIETFLEQNKSFNNESF